MGIYLRTAHLIGVALGAETLPMTGGAFLNIALCPKGVMIGATSTNARPPRRMEGDTVEQVGALAIACHAKPAVTTLTESLQSMAGATVSTVSPCINGMGRYVIANMEIHGLGDAVVTINAIVFFVTTGTQSPLPLRGHFMRCPKVHRVRSAGQLRSGTQLPGLSKIGFHNTA